MRSLGTVKEVELTVLVSILVIVSRGSNITLGSCQGIKGDLFRRTKFRRVR